MKPVEELEKEYFEIKRQYGELIDSRLEMLKRGEFVGRKEGGKFFPEEISLYNRSEEIRKKLLALKPEEWHYGAMNTSAVSRRKKKKFSAKGDNGYFICCECKGLFKHEGNYKESETVCDNESFESCKCHEGRKSIGKLVLKLGGE